MILDWQAKEQKNPLSIKATMDKKEFMELVPDLDVKKIKRKCVFSDTQLDDTGQLYFNIVAYNQGKLLWVHLLNEKFITEIVYPSGSKIEGPEKPEVTVFRSAKKYVVDVDGIYYTFLAENVADPHIKDIENPAELVVALLYDMLERPEFKIKS